MNSYVRVHMCRAYMGIYMCEVSTECIWEYVMDICIYVGTDTCVIYVVCVYICVSICTVCSMWRSEVARQYTEGPKRSQEAVGVFLSTGRRCWGFLGRVPSHLACHRQFFWLYWEEDVSCP